VNIAAKLGEDLAGRGEILVSARAYEEAGKPAEYEAAEYAVSGMPVAVWRRNFG
jgi:class 3 adenylate cyclase